MLETLFVLCLAVIAILAFMVAVLWFQLWLTRRDVRILRQRAYVAYEAEEPVSGGCLGTLMGPVILILLGLLALAFMQI